MAVRIGPHEFDHVSYDEDGDVLYLSVGEPQEAADSAETAEGHVIRYDSREHIIGVTIVNAKWILDRNEAVALTLPGRLATAGLARQMQIKRAALAETIYTMAELPDEWKASDEGKRAQNWVAAVHRSRRQNDPAPAVLPC